jgi:hypothetical protein
MGKIKIVSASIILFISGFSFAQETTITPDLSQIVNEDGWNIFNRKVRLIKDSGNVSIYFNGQEGDGFARLNDFEFNNGIIEADIKGKNVQGNSFVGIAFHGADEQTYDAVYFRPFNFMSEDSIRKRHSVQYISAPTFSWDKLRREYPQKYENTVNPIPDPDSFFHAKIVIEKPKIRVFVNGAEEPCLVVNELSDRTGGWIGLWVGNYSDGTFANLKITRGKE